MKRLFSIFAAIMLASVPAFAQQEQNHEDKQWSIAIHGGAGTIERSKLTPEKDAEIRAALQAALDAGSKILEGGGSSMEAIKAAIVILEDDPNFNAGKGAVFTWEETNSLDASIMDGRDRSAGAVAGVAATKNPILLAEAVKDKSPHVLLSGAGADQFSAEQGLEQVEPDYFATPRRLKQIKDFKAKRVSRADIDYKFGTVGAVAMDKDGNMAAGTSTGGMTGKRWGRIGDSPIIGAGTYADNRSCAVSATGSGEFFIRVGVAQEICTRIRPEAPKCEAIWLDDMSGEYVTCGPVQRLPTIDHVQKIADEVIAEMGSLGGSGGVILATPWGQAIYSFDTPGMYRGRATSEGENSVAIYGDE